jgi:hypothetical protein
MSTLIDVPLPALSVPQVNFLAADERCQDFEGAIRCGKSTVAMLKVWLFALKYPGICMLVCRWKDSDVNGQLRKLWREVGAWFPADCQPTWDGQEESYLFPHGSLVYMRSLKSSEETARYSKFRGLTLAVVYIDQAEEVPEDVYVELKGRLSQPGMPHQIILSPNPVDDDHWIANHFPEDGDRPGHRYLTADVYSNRAILGDEVIRGFEEDYPIGHPKRRTLIEGKRGVNVVGKPVYDGYFGLDLVKEDLEFDPNFELLEGWDFGHAYPAVVWAQYFPTRDILHVLGAMQGKDMFLEDFVPHVKDIRDVWFPHALINSWCDPSGETGNQGIKQTALTTLQDMDIPVIAAEKANDPATRDKAIQTMASLMFRKRFKVNPRCVELSRVNRQLESRETRLVVSALSVGYVWDERKALRSNPNIRSPKKGTRYDHCMNGLEYITTGAKIPGKVKPGDIQRAVKAHKPAIVRHAQLAIVQERAALNAAQRDTDEDLVPVSVRGRVMGRSFARSRRGGY